MKLGYKRRKKLGRVLLYVFIILVSLMVFGPYVWMGITSFKKPSEVTNIPPTLIPQQGLTLQNYIRLFKHLPAIHI